jgi:hypothetical protein
VGRLVGGRGDCDAGSAPPRLRELDTGDPDYAAAARLAAEALPSLRATGDDPAVALAEIPLGVVKAIAGDREAGIALFEETVERTRNLGYEAETLAIGALGRRRAIRGEGGEAKELLAESLRRTLKLRAWLGTALYLDLLGDLAAAEGEDRLRAGARVGARGDA